jgi:D-beta-D-heptose 7-phosphate kinase/D-beta-D-heptose 1-phosphate adenosyltransferase
MMEVPVFLDPRPVHADSYHPLTVLTPNRKEAEEMVGFPVRTDNDLRKAAEQLLEKTEGSAVLITRGDQGMALLERGGRMRKIATVAREVYDVTGAGDTVIAVLALAHAAGASFLDAARLANYAAGIVVGHVGTAVPSVGELSRALSGGR